jgi:hypothetical protein
MSDGPVSTKFAIGAEVFWLKFHEITPYRSLAGFLGEVVGVRESPEGFLYDVEFWNGELVRDIAEHWLSPNDDEINPCDTQCSACKYLVIDQAQFRSCSECSSDICVECGLFSGDRDDWLCDECFAKETQPAPLISDSTSL